MKTRARPFFQVDVFAQQPYSGNGLAVVMDSQDLSEAQMQAFARWTQLSETTFVLPPTAAEADYQVRIFTPGGELPFAGHPTLGSCHAWLEAGGQPREPGRVVQQCAVGLVHLRREATDLAFAAPALRRQAIDPTRLPRIISALGLAPGQVQAAQELDNGPLWFGLLLDSADTVRRLEPDHAQLRALGTKIGVAAAQGTDLLVRAFAAPVGILEDPVTGSLNASLAQWLIEEGHMPSRYRASQGASVRRDGRIELHRDAHGQVWVGGASVTCISGQVWL